MVTSPVPHKHSVLPPVLVLPVQLYYELIHEQFHGVCVGIRLQETDVDNTMIVKGYNHGDSRSHFFGGDAVT